MPDPLAGISADELFGRGIGFARNGDLWRAEQYLVASMEKGKPRGEVVPTLVQICIALQRFSAALSYAEPVVRDEPDHWRLRRVVASLYHGLGRLEDARDAFHTVLRAAPNDPMTHYFLGMLYVEDLSDVATGDPLLARYVELAPEGQHAPEVRALLRRLRTPRSSIERIDSDDVPSVEPSVPVTELNETGATARIVEQPPEETPP
jgi:Flp pilus assembly protein TadD